jgi:exodeoxyribonuclease III
MPTFRIATWNINSVRLRAPLVIRFLEEYQPDILCLQETKCPPGQFPAAAFKQAGYPHIADNGYTGHHGVAIVSRVAFSRHSVKSFCDQNDGRHVCINPHGTSLFVHSLYVPAGGDEPDASINPKFAHKLRFLDELKDWGQALRSTTGEHHILTGDLNIAPLENDVWSHKQLLAWCLIRPKKRPACRTSCRPAGFTIRCALTGPNLKSSIPGGATGQRNGTRPTRAAGWTISGCRRNLPAVPRNFYHSGSEGLGTAIRSCAGHTGSRYAGLSQTVASVLAGQQLVDRLNIEMFLDGGQLA